MIEKIKGRRVFSRYRRFRKKHTTFCTFLLCCMLVFLINFGVSSIFGVNIMKTGATKFLTSIGIYTEEIPSVTLNSDNFSDPGSWQIGKSAEWTGVGKAQVKFDVKTVVDTAEVKRDVILVLDISGSMTGSRLSMMKQDTKELISYILGTEGSRVALITFDTTSTIMSNFTDNASDLLGFVDGLEERNCTNYYAGLANVSKVLEGYERREDCELVTLFLTDGYPNIDTPNQVGQYHILKDKYPYMVINGIQYEMGKEMVKELAEITDNQFAADMENLGNVLYAASVDPKYFEKFVITDYVEDELWTVKDINSIKVDKGSVRLEEEDGGQKIVWNLLNIPFMTGEAATMTIDIELKEEYLGGEGFYPTNKGEDVTSKVNDKSEDKFTSTKTPVLKADYLVTYNSNLPAKCGNSTEESEKHYAFENVTKRSEGPECSGYQFKGWEIVDDGVKKINSDVFVMPTKDIMLRGVWSKVAVDKSMIGTVKEKANLYDIVMNDSDSGNYARKYSGGTSSINGNQNVYYYYDAAASNNVIFGNYCWKIVRTTDTGGVKMIYNGVPSEDGKCNNTGAAAQLTGEQMGTSSDTSGFASDNYFSNKSPANVGYMFDSSYNVSTKDMSSSVLEIPTEDVDYSVYTNIVNSSVDSSGNSTEFVYDDSTKKWTSSNHSDGSTSEITFSVNADGLYFINYQMSSESGYDKATFYVDGVQKGTFSGSEKGTLRLENITTSNVIKVVYSKDSSGSTGSDTVTFGLSQQVEGEVIDNRWSYGNSFKYEGGVYTLVDSKKVDFVNESGELANHHYTCFNTEGTCSSLAYIYRADEKRAFIIYVKGDEDIENALDNMIYTKANKENSAVKTAIDTWYLNNMVPYTDYLEDAVWCNNRKVNRPGGWNPNGGNITTTSGDMYFISQSTSNDLSCPNMTDKFTTKTENGNGALTYPVGLITKQEVGLAGPAIWSGSTYWTMTPFYFVQQNACDFIADSSQSYGVRYWCSVMGAQGVRPTISIRSGIKTGEGDGSADYPYKISMDN